MGPAETPSGLAAAMMPVNRDSLAVGRILIDKDASDLVRVVHVELDSILVPPVALGVECRLVQ
jgi:hypothetical protein